MGGAHGVPSVTVWACAALLGATVAFRSRSTFTSGSETVSIVGFGSAQRGEEADDEAEESRIIMFNAKHRRGHTNNMDRTSKDWARHNRRNSAAANRFLWMPDGTCWRRQKGVRHLKSVKSKRRLRRLNKLVKLTKPEKRRVFVLTGRRIRAPKADMLIRRKFPESRLNQGKGMSDVAGQAICSL